MKQNCLMSSPFLVWRPFIHNLFKAENYLWTYSLICNEFVSENFYLFVFLFETLDDLEIVIPCLLSIFMEYLSVIFYILMSKVTISFISFHKLEMFVYMCLIFQNKELFIPSSSIQIHKILVT